MIDTPLAINRRRVEQLVRVAHDRYHPGVILGASVLTIYDLFASIPRSIVSLPGRAWDARSRLFRDAGPQATPQEVSYVRGEAAAEMLLLGTEVGSYVFMGRGFFQPGQGLVEGANIAFNPSRGTAALFATRQRAFSFAPATVAVGGGAATLTSSSFGGPMGRPEAVRMGRADKTNARYQPMSEIELTTGILDEIESMKAKGGEWGNLARRGEKLFRETKNVHRRITDLLIPLHIALRSQSRGLRLDQVSRLLDIYESALSKGDSFVDVRWTRNYMLQKAKYPSGGRLPRIEEPTYSAEDWNLQSPRPTERKPTLDDLDHVDRDPEAWWRFRR